jgi:TetR/AcrR family transcriptional regulator, transcriptional repressor for nem operon
MARILKQDQYDARRSEILDTARHLIYKLGYDQMTIHDLLEELHISKGALYHYFASKEALLEALVDRMGQEATQNLLLITQDQDLTAVQKLRRFLETSASWKSSQKELIIGLMRLWFSDENAFIRHKMSDESRKHMSAFLEPIIRQGVAEGTFTTRFPKQAALIIAGVSLSLTDTMTGLVLLPHLDQAAVQELGDTLEAYVDTVERILGAPTGSLHVFEPGIFADWLTEAEPAPAE